jgi:hypothetical protein
MTTTTITTRYLPSVILPKLTINCNSCLKESHGCIYHILLFVVSIDELDIDSIDGFEKTMPRLHPKPDGEEPECYCSDVCKMQVSRDYKTLWQWFWMCNNLTYDPESGDTEV